MIASWQESYDKPKQCVKKQRQKKKKQRHHFADKGPYSQGYDLSSSHVQIWELNYKEGRALKNWCFPTVVLEKTFKNPLESKEIKPVNFKGNQPWILFGRTDAEPEAPILWPVDVKSQLTGKKPWCWGRWKAKGEGGGKRMRWLDSITDRLNGREFEETRDDNGEKKSLVQSTGLQRVRQDLVTGSQQ